MENKIALIVPGQPQAWQRPGWSPRGAYTQKKTLNYETYIKEMFAVSYPDFMPLEGPLRMKITAWLMIPKSTSKKRAKLMVERIIIPEKKPDHDNLVKIVSDALEKLAYRNDSQIATCIFHKFYSMRPRLEIKISGAQISGG